MANARAIREDPNVLAFKRAADRYCQHLETSVSDPDRWVEDILASLAMLYASGLALPEFEVNETDADVPSEFDVGDAEWRRVCELVHKALGPQVGYWCYFDPSEPPDSKDEPVFGQLGDDLADIYRDLKPGLRAWDTGIDEYLPSIVFDWKFPLLGSHWGVHAVNAMRALHPIAFLRGVQNRGQRG